MHRRPFSLTACCAIVLAMIATQQAWAQPEKETDSGGETDSGAETDSDAGPENDSGAASNSETDADSDPDSGAETDPVPEAGAGAETDSGAASNSETDASAETDSGADSGAETDSGAELGRIEPPRLLEELPTRYPQGASESGTVLLAITVTERGAVEDAQVISGVSEIIDEAALESVRGWRFEPAEHAGQPTAARIRVAIPFVAPTTESVRRESEGATAGRPGREQASAFARDRADQNPGDNPDNDMHLEVTVHGERALRAEKRSASDYFIHREELEAAPRREGAEALLAAPGLFVGRSQGLAVAHSYFLRGFDAEHGQDIEFSVGGLPINLPSHVHGQGYTDLGFLIDGVVDHLEVSEGVSDPDQGDFAVAGSIDVGLGIDEQHRGLQVRSGYGSFDTFEQTVIWAPKLADRESFGAARFATTDGFGHNRSGSQGSGIVQHRFGSGELRYRAIGLVHAARGNLAGVLRRDDIEAGEVCFHCVYPYPTARAQNALNQRVMAGLFADYFGPEHATGSIGFWLGHDTFRLQRNFTGFTDQSRALDDVAGRGDLIEQRNRTSSLGLTGRYRTEAFEPTTWAHGTVEVGTEGRIDLVDQRQNLLDAAVRNQTWDERVDASVSALSVAVFGDLDWQLGERFNARVGLRGALLSYEIDDRLSNFAPSVRPDDAFLPGFRRSAQGLFAGPRASLEYRAAKWLDLLAAYGEGYRSPQARILEDGEQAPFARVRSADLGARARFGSTLELNSSLYATRLSDDVAFQPAEGSLERIGPTQRLGFVARVVAEPWSWLLGSASVTYVNAVLLEPPAATAEEPAPPFESGQRLPFVAPWVVRLEASAKRNVVDDLAGAPLVARASVGFSFLSSRPLPYDQYADAVPLLDGSVGLGWRALDFDLAGYNLLDLDYANQEYVFVSHWNPDAVASRLPARHVAAGAPLTIMARLGLTL